MNANVAPIQLCGLMMGNSVRIKTLNIALQYCIHWHCQVNPEGFEQNRRTYFNSRITCELTILRVFLFLKWEWT